jgi:hypothetical protein
MERGNGCKNFILVIFLEYFREEIESFAVLKSTEKNCFYYYDWIDTSVGGLLVPAYL